MVEVADGIGPLIERYDGFLLDQFGVLHDGLRALPGALPALRALKAADKTVLILSNSGRRARPNAERLAAMGVTHDLHAGVLTSGEVAWLGLRERREPPFAGLGTRCLFASRGGERSALDGLPLIAVEDANEADFVHLSGVPDDEAGRSRLERQLVRAAARGLPLLCSNPDLKNVIGERLLEGPGAFARRHAERGGEVRYVGKPHPAIYRAALARLDLPPERVVGVGDSLGHDVAGAAGVGLASALVATGVHAEVFADAADDAAMRAALDPLSAEEGVRPDWLVRRFAP